LKYIAAILIVVGVTVVSQLPVTVAGEDCPISYVEWGRAYYAPCHNENDSILHCKIESDQCLLGYE